MKVLVLSILIFSLLRNDRDENLNKLINNRWVWIDTYNIEKLENSNLHYKSFSYTAGRNARMVPKPQRKIIYQIPKIGSGFEHIIEFKENGKILKFLGDKLVCDLDNYKFSSDTLYVGFESPKDYNDNYFYSTRPCNYFCPCETSIIMHNDDDYLMLINIDSKNRNSASFYNLSIDVYKSINSTSKIDSSEFYIIDFFLSYCKRRGLNYNIIKEY